MCDMFWYRHCSVPGRDERRVSGDRHDSRDRKGLLQTRLGLTEDVPFEKFVERAGRFLEEVQCINVEWDLKNCELACTFNTIHAI